MIALKNVLFFKENNCYSLNFHGSNYIQHQKKKKKVVVVIYMFPRSLIVAILLQKPWADLVTND